MLLYGPKQDTRCVDEEGRARRFGAKIGREPIGQFVKKFKNPKTPLLAQIHFLPNNLVWSQFEVKIWNFSS